VRYGALGSNLAARCVEPITDECRRGWRISAITGRSKSVLFPLLSDAPGWPALTSDSSVRNPVTLSLAERDLLSALSLYLATKGTALRSALRLRAPLTSEQALDLRIHYSNYFVNLLSAIELIREGPAPTSRQFSDALDAAFSIPKFPNGAENYAYIRELRNAIVHRGFDIASAAHFAAGIPLLIAPSTIANRGGNHHYKAFSYYVLGIVERCEAVVGPTIESHLSTLGLLERAPDHQEVLSEFLELVDQSSVMPEWAKKMARENMGEIDYKVSHLTSIAKLRDLLKPASVVPNSA